MVLAAPNLKVDMNPGTAFDRVVRPLGNLRESRAASASPPIPPCPCMRPGLESNLSPPPALLAAVALAERPPAVKWPKAFGARKRLNRLAFLAATSRQAEMNHGEDGPANTVLEGP